MIKRIDRIRNYRIFRNFKWSNSLNDFGKYNLIYGLNGSGKSTLSNIFECLAYKNSLNEEGVEFSIETNDITITNKNIASSNENIYVFNKNFINSNLEEFSNLKGIVYLSDKNIDLKKQLDILKVDLKAKIKKQEKDENDLNVANKNLDSTLSTAARNIKEEFHIIGGIGNQFSNYNKAALQSDIERNMEFLKTHIDSEQLKILINQKRDLLKDEVKSIIEPLDISFLTPHNTIKEFVELINKNIKSSTSQILGENLFSWLNEGFELHKDNVCLYCGNIISENRIQELQKIFNNEIKAFKENLTISIEKCKMLKIKDVLLDVNSFNKSFNEEVKVVIENIRKLLFEYNQTIDLLENALESKRNNPYLNINMKMDIDKTLVVFDDFMLNLSKYNKLVDENNSVTKNYKNAQQNALIELKKLFVYENYFNLQIKQKKESVLKLTEINFNNKASIRELNNDIANIETELVDVIKAGNKFNELLTKFLGRNEIELKFDETTKGYKVIRKENNEYAKNLSEGEKTAIAFVYFLTKVKENGNQIANSIIVFDDPITSMDSNHIFNAYSFICSYFDDSQQLFVLTHNFTFFKLVRRHFGKDKKSNNFYFIKNNYVILNEKRVRTAEIIKLPSSILQASSEYPYLVNVLMEFNKSSNDVTNMELHDYLSIANTARKVIESFCSFKVPHRTNVFKDSIEALYKCNHDENYCLTNEEILECEKIYKFVNTFSHDNAYFDEEDLNSLIGESNNVISDILNLIERTDKDHFRGLKKQIGNL